MSDFLELLHNNGIRIDDPRLVLDWDKNKKIDERGFEKISFAEFKRIAQKSQGNIIKDAIQGNFIIPDFQSFSKEVENIFEETKNIRDGKVATYIPQLSRVNPEFFAVSICTIDGQRASYGLFSEPFCIQSVCKPLNYAIILEELGEEKVHKHIGREPSGIGFNGLVLNKDGLPHNPMINAGAIMACSLLRPQLDMADRFDHVINTWKRLSGGKAISFNNSVYLSERETADRNFALGYFMKERKAFPENTNLINTLEFYFQCCSIETNTEALAIAAGTLANAGICPTTGEKIFNPDTVKSCLSLMLSCGMYDFSGEWAFSIGLPAKSGVAGGLMVVIPNLMGICIWSPRLDELGNSVRGVEFCKQLVKEFNFHNYDSLTKNNPKVDPRKRKNESKIDSIISLCWAASDGDLTQVQQLVARGINFNEADYDGRTALHLAASEGHLKVIEYLIGVGVKLNPIDRWGNTPLDDAKNAGHQGVVNTLSKAIAALN